MSDHSQPNQVYFMESSESIPPNSSAAFTAERSARESSFYSNYATEGLVTAAHSEDNSVDVTLESGITLTRVPVESPAPVGENTDRGFGERYLPMKNSRVYVHFASGPNRPDLARVLPGFFQKATSLKQELLVKGKESIHRKITEDGLDYSHDRSTGLITLTDPDGFSLKIDRANKLITLVPWDGNSSLTAGPNSVKADIQGNTIELTQNDFSASVAGNTISADNTKVTINSLEVLK